MKIPTFIENTKRSSPIILTVIIILHFFWSIPAIYLLTNPALGQFTLYTNGLVNQTLLINLFTIIIYGTILFLFDKLKPIDLGLDSSKLLKGLLIGVLAWLTVNLICIILASLSSEVIFSLKTFTSKTVGSLVGQLFGNALIEELLFRGYLTVQLFLIFKDRQISNQKSLISAIIIGQLVFSLQHLSDLIIYEQAEIQNILVSLFVKFIIGSLLALIYFKTENLFFTIIVHSLVNQPFQLIQTSLPVNLLVLLIGLVLAFAGQKLIWRQK